MRLQLQVGALGRQRRNHPQEQRKGQQALPPLYLISPVFRQPSMVSSQTRQGKFCPSVHLRINQGLVQAHQARNKQTLVRSTASGYAVPGQSNMCLYLGVRTESD